MSDQGHDPNAINPHTGQPVPDDAPVPARSASGAPAAAAAPASPAPPAPAASSASAPAAAATPGSPTAAAPVTSPAAAAASGDAPPSQQEMAVRAALETVMDPEIGLSVIDLGLIREVIVTADKTLVKMMLTTPFCPYAPQMVADVKAAAQSVVPQDCDVDLLPDPWSPDLMPDPSLLGYSF